MEIYKRNGENLSVLPKLFSMGLEEIVQNIFLHLDPKSLKNMSQILEERIFRKFPNHLLFRKVYHLLPLRKRMKFSLCPPPIAVLFSLMMITRRNMNTLKEIMTILMKMRSLCTSTAFVMSTLPQIR